MAMTTHSGNFQTGDMMRREGISIVRLFAALAASVLVTTMGMAAAATLTVTNTSDSGTGSLRAAVAAAGAGDTIVISVTGTIGLASAIPIAAAMSISGPGADKLAISGGSGTRIFDVTSTASISGLTMQDGFAGGVLLGGAIRNTGSLTLDSVALIANVAIDGGGAIYNESTSASTGQLTIRNSELSGNRVTDPAGIGGGAILSTSSVGNAASVTIVNSTISGNSVNDTPGNMVGGGIYFAKGALRIFNSTVAVNKAGTAGGDIHQASVAGTSLTIRNSIISGGAIDMTGAPADIDIFQPGGATVASLGYNIVTNRSVGTGYTATDAANGTNPLLGTLAANGGPTRSMLPQALSPAGRFVPLAACLDNAGAALTRDQRGYLRQTPGATTCDAGATEALALLAVVSRKFHAGVRYDLPIVSTIPLAGPVNVEPRGIGAGHQLVFQFNGPVTSAGVPAISPVGSVTASPLSGELIATLTNVPDNQRVTVSVPSVNGVASPVSASLGFLVGDVSGSRAVNAIDISAVKARAGAVNSANFRFDLNASGVIANDDVSAVKARSGMVMP